MDFKNFWCQINLFNFIFCKHFELHSKGYQYIKALLAIVLGTHGDTRAKRDLLLFYLFQIFLPPFLLLFFSLSQHWPGVYNLRFYSHLTCLLAWFLNPAAGVFHDRAVCGVDAALMLIPSLGRSICVWPPKWCQGQAWTLSSIQRHFWENHFLPCNSVPLRVLEMKTSQKKKNSYSFTPETEGTRDVGNYAFPVCMACYQKMRIERLLIS